VLVLTVTHLSRDDNEKALYSTAYKNILEFIPGLKKYLPVNRDGDWGRLYKLLEKVRRTHVSHNTINIHCTTDAEREQHRPL
jgi:hypothetical protein